MYYTVLEHKESKERIVVPFVEYTPKVRSYFRFVRKAKAYGKAVRYYTFLTFTYSNEFYDDRSPNDMKSCMHNIRNKLNTIHGKKILGKVKHKYVWREDYGKKTKRFHYHCLSNLVVPACLVHRNNQAYKMVQEFRREVDCQYCFDILRSWERWLASEVWHKGFVNASPLWRHKGAYRYITKYMTKQNIDLGTKMSYIDKHGKEKSCRRFGFANEKGVILVSEWRMVVDEIELDQLLDYVDQDVIDKCLKD